MRSQWKRLLWAACLSLACAGLTVGWYYGTAKISSSSNEPPLALASSSSGEVMQRPPTRLLWQTVSTGDNLYSGQTIRTSDQGELRIQFEDGRYIQLEPESLIVLQKKQGQISLDLLDGSAFVNGKGGAAGGAAMVLTSAGNSVDLTNASAALTKNSDNRVNLRVMDGQVKVKGKDGKEVDIKSGKDTSVSASGAQEDQVVILSPVSGKPVFVNPETQNPVTFKWKGYPSNLRVSLMMGPTRKGLKEVAHLDPSDDGDSELEVKLPLGKYWFKLTAKDPATGVASSESALNRIEIQGRFAPTLTVPKPDGVVTIEKQPSVVNFAWHTVDEPASIHLEIAATPDLVDPILDKTFAKKAGESMPASVAVPGLKAGVHYYARLSSTYPESEDPIPAKVRHFVLQLPAAKDPAQITWNIPADKREQFFVLKPELALNWESKTRQDEIASYRVILENDGHADQKAVQFDTKDTHAKANLAAAGRYIASVEAYDKAGGMIGRSEPMTLTSSETPILAAPILQPADGNLMAGADGKTELKWDAVPAAKEYLVTVKTKEGKQLLHRKYGEPTAKLKNLMPGEYSVNVEGIDGFGRSGHEGAVRKLIVPEGSGLKSPKLKKVQVD